MVSIDILSYSSDSISFRLWDDKGCVFSYLFFQSSGLVECLSHSCDVGSPCVLDSDGFHIVVSYVSHWRVSVDDSLVLDVY